jgi:hypothetical protein
MNIVNWYMKWLQLQLDHHSVEICFPKKDFDSSKENE